MKNNIKRIIPVVMVCLILLTGIVFAKDTRIVTDRVVLFHNIQVASNEEVRGSVVSIFGNADIDGKVSGDLVTIFGNSTIDGTVMGNVVSIFGGIKLGSSGKIQGDAVQIMGGMQEEPGSYIGGARISISDFGIPGISGFPMLLMLILIWTIAKLIIGYVVSVIAVLIFPQKFDHMADSAAVDIGRKFLIGIMIIIGYYVVAAMLVMVVIGIPFVLLLAPLMALLGFTGNTAVKLSIGKKLGRSLGRDWSQMTELFMGTLLYGFVDLTIIGKSATFLAKAIGIGAVIDSKGGIQKPLKPINMGFISLKKEEVHIDDRTGKDNKQ